LKKNILDGVSSDGEVLMMLLQLIQTSVTQRMLSAPMVTITSLIALIIIGAIIIFIAGVFIFFLPAIIVAGIVWWLTGSRLMAGVAFLIISVLSLVKRK